MATAIVQQPSERLAVGSRWILAVVCLLSGIACLAARWMPGGPIVRVTYGVVIAVLLLGVALRARRSSAQALSSLAFAFFVFAVVQVLNNLVPPYLGTTIMHRPPVNGDPLGSTVAATAVDPAPGDSPRRRADPGSGAVVG